MGKLIGEDDVLIPRLFASMNERFAPSPEPETVDGEPVYHGGVKELAALAKSFVIFKNDPEQTSLSELAQLLSLGGPMPLGLRRRWYAFLRWIEEDCTLEGTENKAGPGIIDRLKNNVTGVDGPRPVVFMPYHDKGELKKVKIEMHAAASGPAFYLTEAYTLIKLPMYHEKKAPK